MSGPAVTNLFNIHGHRIPLAKQNARLRPAAWKLLHTIMNEKGHRLINTFPARVVLSPPRHPPLAQARIAVRNPAILTAPNPLFNGRQPLPGQAGRVCCAGGSVHDTPPCLTWVGCCGRRHLPNGMPNFASHPPGPPSSTDPTHAARDKQANGSTQWINLWKGRSVILLVRI